MHNKKLFLSGILTAALIIIFDQLTKNLILHHFVSGFSHQSVTSFFDLVLVYNKGVSFGMLTQDTSVGVNILIFMTGLITVAMIICLWRAQNLLQSLSFGCVIGGACGNIIDRISYGSVVDFLLFHWHQYTFPAFNIADTFITIGAVLILIENFFASKEQYHNVT